MGILVCVLLNPLGRLSRYEGCYRWSVKRRRVSSVASDEIMALIAIACWSLAVTCLMMFFASFPVLWNESCPFKGGEQQAKGASDSVIPVGRDEVDDGFEVRVEVVPTEGCRIACEVVDCCGECFPANEFAEVIER